jgi:hypothetical protein
MPRSKTTSSKVARLASRLLRSKSTPKKVKSVAASALAQKPSCRRKRR